VRVINFCIIIIIIVCSFAVGVPQHHMRPTGERLFVSMYLLYWMWGDISSFSNSKREPLGG